MRKVLQFWFKKTLKSFGFELFSGDDANGAGQGFLDDVIGAVPD